nr:hypothetical protein [Salinispora mooreana]
MNDANTMLSEHVGHSAVGQFGAYHGQIVIDKLQDTQKMLDPSRNWHFNNGDILPTQDRPNLLHPFHVGATTRPDENQVGAEPQGVRSLECPESANRGKDGNTRPSKINSHAELFACAGDAGHPCHHGTLGRHEELVTNEA